MKKHEQKAADSDKKPIEERKTGEKAEVDLNACRCKEVSRKSPRDLLKLMVDDLVFWKKEK
jgi:hypothetical protein